MQVILHSASLLNELDPAPQEQGSKGEKKGELKKKKKKPEMEIVKCVRWVYRFASGVYLFDGREESLGPGKPENGHHLLTDYPVSVAVIAHSPKNSFN